MKNQHILILAISILTLSACGHGDKSKKQTIADEVIPVQVMEISKGSDKQVITVSGQFSTDDETILSFKTGGIVSKVFVKEGDKIRKGQILATLDLTEIKSMVNQAKLAFEKAQRDLKRATNLNADGFATLEQMQNAQSGYNVAAEQYESAKFNLKYSEIRAVSDGFVLRKMVNNGQLVSPGMPSFQTNGAGNATWLLKAGIGDVEWSAVKVGDLATISSDILQDKKIKGTVVRKSQGTDPNNGSFAIEIAVDKNQQVKLASGMFGTASIKSSSSDSLWRIPYEAIMDGNANEGYVFVTDDSQTAQKVQVKIQTIQKSTVLISSGLENHSTLIIAGNAYLTDGSKINIVKVKK